MIHSANSLLDIFCLSNRSKFQILPVLKVSAVVLFQLATSTNQWSKFVSYSTSTRNLYSQASFCCFLLGSHQNISFFTSFSSNSTIFAHFPHFQPCVPARMLPPSVSATIAPLERSVTNTWKCVAPPTTSLLLMSSTMLFFSVQVRFSLLSLPKWILDGSPATTPCSQGCSSGYGCFQGACCPLSCPVGQVSREMGPCDRIYGKINRSRTIFIWKKLCFNEAW